jgi:geranylgeranyl diphosphate synthase, type II
VFDLSAHLAARRVIVEAALEKALPPPVTRPSVLHKAMRHAIFTGGKRIRPVLALDAAASVGGRPEDAILPGIAVEILHTYTLVHDDLPCMDDDDLRRGKPTCHVLFGEANAVLAGDALQTLAFEVLAQSNLPAPYSIADLIRELAQAAGSHGVIGGQVEDLAAIVNPDLATVEYVHMHKTADLFRCAVRMGAMAGGATAEELDRLSSYATSIGLAFQITDDLLDETPAAATGGTPATAAQRPEAAGQFRRNQSLSNETIDMPFSNRIYPADTYSGPPPEDKPELTCLSVYGREEANARAKALVDDAISALESLRRGPTEPLRAVAEFILRRKS